MKFLLVLSACIIITSGCKKENNNVVSNLTGTWKKTSVTVDFYDSATNGLLKDTIAFDNSTPNNDNYYAVYKANLAYEYYVLRNNNKIFSTTGKYYYHEDTNEYNEIIDGVNGFGSGNPYQDKNYQGYSPPGKLIFSDNNHLSIVYRLDYLVKTGYYQTTTIKLVKQ